MKLRALLLLCLLAPAAFGQVMINEFLYDTVGRDDSTMMYTEIYGPAGTDLTGWTLVGINGNGGSVYRTVTLNGEIPADGYFVVGNLPSVENVDQVLNTNSDAGIDWQNAGSSSGEDCDGLELRNASGALVDHVCYGNCSAGHVCNGEGGSNAPDPFPAGGTNYSLARLPDHTDANNNATDWSQTDVLTPGQPNDGVPCEPVVASLEDIRSSDGAGVPEMLGSFVIVRGIVNVNNLVFDTTSNFYIQDDNAGCNVFRGTVPQGLLEGDCVEVSAWVDHYNGLTELASFGTGNCLFRVELLEGEGEITPLVLTGSSSFEAFEGMLAEIRNVTIVGGDPWPTPGNNANITITDGNGTLTLRIDRDSQVPTVPQPSGPFTVRGIITQFDDSSPYTDEYQISPRYTTDIIPGTPVDDAPGVFADDFRLLSNYPNPFNGVTNIEFMVGSAREVELSISDVLGREVYNRTLTNLAPGNHTIQWSPTGAAGLYFLRAQSGATVQTAKLLYLK